MTNSNLKKNKALSLLLVNLNNLLSAFSMILCHLLREGKRNEGRLGYYQIMDLAKRNPKWQNIADGTWKKRAKDRITWRNLIRA